MSESDSKTADGHELKTSEDKKLGPQTGSSPVASKTEDDDDVRGKKGLEDDVTEAGEVEEKACAPETSGKISLKGPTDSDDLPQQQKSGVDTAPQTNGLEDKTSESCTKSAVAE